MTTRVPDSRTSREKSRAANSGRSTRRSQRTTDAERDICLSHHTKDVSDVVFTSSLRCSLTPLRVAPTLIATRQQQRRRRRRRLVVLHPSVFCSTLARFRRIDTHGGIGEYRIRTLSRTFIRRERRGSTSERGRRRIDGHRGSDERRSITARELSAVIIRKLGRGW